MIRIGIIGVGVVASYGHIPAIKDTPGLQLVSALDIDPNKLAEAREKYGIPQTFSDLDEFFNSGIDAVVITSSAPAHLAHVMACAKYKKPALCEKPLAMNEDEAQLMIDAMRDAGVPLYVGFTYRFAPVALDIQRMIRSGDIGHLKSLRLFYVWDCHGKYNERGKPESGLYERRVGRMLEGGPMVDCGVHQIDLARWWTGREVQRITGLGAWVETENYESPDHIWLHMDHSGGAHSVVEISYTYGHTAVEPRSEFNYELIGTEGVIRYSRAGRFFEAITSRGTQYLQWTDEKNFHGMYTEFERALRSGQQGDMPTGVDGLTATRLARLATEAAIKWRATA